MSQQSPAAGGGVANSFKAMGAPAVLLNSNKAGGDHNRHGTYNLISGEPLSWQKSGSIRNAGANVLR